MSLTSKIAKIATDLLPWAIYMAAVVIAMAVLL